MHTMTKPIWIQIRVGQRVKEAVEQAARNSGRTTSNYMLWCAAQQSADVAKALGMTPDTANVAQSSPESSPESSARPTE